MQWDPPLFARAAVLAAGALLLWFLSVKAWEGLKRWISFILQIGRDVADIRTSLARYVRHSTSRPPPAPIQHVQQFVAPPPLPQREPTVDATDWADDDLDTGLPDSKRIV